MPDGPNRYLKETDQARKVDRYERNIKRLLAQMIFWNADDSGSKNTVGNDMYRIYGAGMLHDPSHNPDGFVHSVVCGWDAQPQNTYEYLLKRLMPDVLVPSCADQLQRNWEGFNHFISNGLVPVSIRSMFRGFVLDDVFKCTKQSGITSAVYPHEQVKGGLRHGEMPVRVSEMGKQFVEIIDGHLAQQIEQGEVHERSAS